MDEGVKKGRNDLKKEGREEENKKFLVSSRKIQAGAYVRVSFGTGLSKWFSELYQLHRTSASSILCLTPGFGT